MSLAHKHSQVFTTAFTPIKQSLINKYNELKIKKNQFSMVKIASGVSQRVVAVKMPLPTTYRNQAHMWNHLSYQLFVIIKTCRNIAFVCRSGYLFESRIIRRDVLVRLLPIEFEPRYQAKHNLFPAL